MSFNKDTGEIKARDPDGKLKSIQLTTGQELITDDFELVDYLKLILIEQRINNKILNEVHDLNVNENDIERK